MPSEICPRKMCEKGKKEKEGGSPCSIRQSDGDDPTELEVPEKCPAHEAAWWKRQEELWESEMISLRDILLREENWQTRMATEVFWTQLVAGHQKWLKEKIVSKKNKFDYEFCEDLLRECLDEAAELRKKEDLPSTA